MNERILDISGSICSSGGDNKVPVNQDMRIERDSHGYREQKAGGHLRVDDRQRHKRNKDRRKRRQKQWEEDMVKTGSEDESENAVPYRNRPKKGVYKINSKEEPSYVEIKEREDRLRRYMDQLPYTNPRDLSDNGGGRRESVHNVRKIARERQKEFEKRKKKVILAEEYLRRNYNKPGALHHETRLPIKPDIRSRVRETSDSGGTSDDQFREYTRHKRASILNRAEHLIRTMNNQSDRDSFSDQESKADSRVTQTTNMSNRTFTLKKEELEYSDDDDKYVMVSTIVSPEPPNVDLPFRPLPEYNGYRSRLSDKLIPSRIQKTRY